VLLPFILIFMLLLINDRKVMGNYVNGPVVNVISWFTVIILTCLSLAMAVASLV